MPKRQGQSFSDFAYTMQVYLKKWLRGENEFGDKEELAGLFLSETVSLERTGVCSNLVVT